MAVVQRDDAQGGTCRLLVVQLNAHVVVRFSPEKRKVYTRENLASFAEAAAAIQKLRREIRNRRFRHVRIVGAWID